MSALLYRSPNVLIDDHEWHIIVRLATNGHVVTSYRFRPAGVAGRNVMWKPVSLWPYKRLPKGLNAFFTPYKRSVQTAVASAARLPKGIAA